MARSNNFLFFLSKENIMYRGLFAGFVVSCIYVVYSYNVSNKKKSEFTISLEWG